MAAEFARGTIRRFGPFQRQIHVTSEMDLACSTQKKIFERHCGRRLFTTESGYMGLAEFSIEFKDVVAVISGQQMPVVLLPNGTCFEFHGRKDGEAWSEREEDLDLIEII